jgi:hypothetical protein
MAELTILESKLGEVTGLAMAAQAATTKVASLCKNDGADELVPDLERMNQEAAETERRCTELAGSFDGKKTTILEEAQTTKNKASEMMSTYLDDDSDALDGFEFLTMAEAGEVGHWSVLKVLAEKAGNREIGELVEWALPIQEGHLSGVKQASLKLSSEEDPDEPA